MVRQILHILLTVSLITSAGAEAIIIRHDRRDAGYQALAGRYPQVFWLHERMDRRLCLATLVDAEWALTAAHCLEETPLGRYMAEGKPWPVNLGEQGNAIDRVVVHPDFDAATSRNAVGTDLALVHLVNAESITPLGLYQDSAELGQELDIMGWGNTGNGLYSQRTNDHRFRVARNRVSQAGQWLEFVFDDPREPASTALDLEGMPGLGDSGGPALIYDDSGFLIVGVARGELQSVEEELDQGLYGAVAVYERVSLHARWIQEVIKGS